MTGQCPRLGAMGRALCLLDEASVHEQLGPEADALTGRHVVNLTATTPGDYAPVQSAAFVGPFVGAAIDLANTAASDAGQRSDRRRRVTGLRPSR